MWSGSLALSCGSNAAALVAKGLFHLHPEATGIDKLYLAFALRGLAVADYPDIGGDAGVVEELLRQGDNGLQPVIFDDPAANLALATTSIAGEERGAVEDDTDAAAALIDRAHLGNHVLEKEQGAVVDARGACAKAVGIAQGIGLLLDVFLLLLPFHAKGGLASM